MPQVIKHEDNFSVDTDVNNPVVIGGPYQLEGTAPQRKLIVLVKSEGKSAPTVVAQDPFPLVNENTAGNITVYPQVSADGYAGWTNCLGTPSVTVAPGAESGVEFHVTPGYAYWRLVAYGKGKGHGIAGSYERMYDSA